MFETKTKIFAASVLGVLILLVGALVSFTVYLVAHSDAAYDGTSIGYIFAGSYDESYKVSQQLLKDKLAQHALVVPTLLHHRKEFPDKTITVSTPTHLLLVQTQVDLVASVKDAVKNVTKGAKTPEVIFTPVVQGTPYLTFSPPTPPKPPAARNQPTTGTATDHSSTANSGGVSPGNPAGQEINLIRPAVVPTDRSSSARSDRSATSDTGRSSPYSRRQSTFPDGIHERQVEDQSVLPADIHEP